LEALAVPSKSALDAANVQYGTEVKQPLRKKLLDQGKTPLEADEMMKSPSDVRRLIESDPELKTRVDVIDAVIKARDEYTEALNPLKDEVRTREAGARRIAVEIAREAGLIPENVTREALEQFEKKIKFRETQSTDGGRGSYSLGTGEVAINKSLLKAKDPGALFEGLAHELTHAEQDALVIRMIAQRENIAHPLTDATQVER